MKCLEISVGSGLGQQNPGLDLATTKTEVSVDFHWGSWSRKYSPGNWGYWPIFLAPWKKYLLAAVRINWITKLWSAQGVTLKKTGEAEGTSTCSVPPNARDEARATPRQKMCLAPPALEEFLPQVICFLLALFPECSLFTSFGRWGHLPSYISTQLREHYQAYKI